MKKLIMLLALLAYPLLPGTAQIQPAIRVNCGGPTYLDPSGHVFAADYGYSGGASISETDTIKGTSQGPLYQNARYTQSGTSMSYSFNVINGPYHVNLYFAETYPPLMAVGARIFNVKMQSATVFPKLDIFAEAGSDAALIKGTDISVTNGKITIEFHDVVQNSIVNAIEITAGNSGPQLSLNFKYPDGTPVAGTLNYSISSSLLSFQGHEVLNNGQASCALIANPKDIGVSVQFTINASLTDTAGNLLWQMNIGMNPSQVNLAAVQNSNLFVTVQKYTD